MTRYRTIVADPPWPFRWSGGPGGRRRQATPLAYELMSIDAICAVEIPAMADCALFLWVTNELHREGVGAKVARTWGFRPVAELIWRKPNYGTGAFPRSGHEVCIVASRGLGLSLAPRDVHSVQTWSQPRAGNNGGKIHSAKPDGFYDLVERACPVGPYLELFARRARFGWDYAGDGSLGTVDLPGLRKPEAIA